MTKSPLLFIALGFGLIQPGRAQDGPLTLPRSVPPNTLYVTTGVETFSPGDSIPVCWIQSGFDAEKAIIRDAILNSWPRHGKINFYGFMPCPTTGSFWAVRVLVEMGSDTDGGGSAILGRAALQPPGGARSMHIALPRSGNVGRIRYLAVHEAGHTLGFGHEQDRNDNADPPNPRCNPDGAISGRNLTWYDGASIMHYCSGRLFTGELSVGDKVGVGLLYYAPPSIANPFFYPSLSPWAVYPSGFRTLTVPPLTPTLLAPTGPSLPIAPIRDLDEPEGEGLVYQDVKVIPGRTYSISAGARVTAGGTAAALLSIHNTRERNVQVAPPYTGSTSRRISVLYTGDSTGYFRQHLVRRAGTGAVFWSMPSVTEVPSNAEFEQGGSAVPYGWTPNPDTFKAAPSPDAYFAGRASVAMPSGDGHIFQTVTLAPSTSYSFTVMLATTPGATAKGVVRAYGLPALGPIASTPSSPGLQWKRVSVIFKTDPAGRARLELGRVNGSGVVYFDSASITTAPFNGGFELSVAEFSLNGSSPAARASTTAARTGMLGLLMAPGSTRVTTDIAVVQLMLYRISVWVRGDGIGKPRMEIRDPQTNYVRTVEAATASTSWQQLSVDAYGGPAGTARISLIRPDTSGDFHFDDLTVEPRELFMMN